MEALDRFLAGASQAVRDEQQRRLTEAVKQAAKKASKELETAIYGLADDYGKYRESFQFPQVLEKPVTTRKVRQAHDRAKPGITFLQILKKRFLIAH
jgi:predicted neutral ceramidase superfamily lipid hydrolase